MNMTPEQVRNGKIGRLYVRYLIPTILGTLMGSLYNMADLIFVGNGVGGDALAALSIASPMYATFSAIVCLFGIGASTAQAVCLGEQETRKANEIFTQSQMILFGIGVLLTLGMQLLLEPLSRFLGATDLLLPLVEEYMGVVSLAAPGFLIAWSMGNFVRNDGNPRLVMWASIIPNLCNIVLDYVFVFPMQMGLFGAGLATALSPIAGILILFLHFLRKNRTLRYVRPRFTLQSVWRMVRNGCSYGVQEISAGVMMFLFNGVMLSMGGESAVAAYSVVMNVGWIALGMIGGFVGGAQPIIGINYGAAKYDRCRKAFRMACIWTAAFGGITVAALMLFPAAFMSLFTGDDVALTAMCADAGRLYLPMLIPATVNVSVLCLVQSCEWYRQSLLISLSRSLVLMMLCLFVMSALFGITGAWTCMIVSELLTAVLSVLIYRSLMRDFRSKEQLYRLAESVPQPQVLSEAAHG